MTSSTLRVTMFEDLLERIAASVDRADVEVGGKFIGKIQIGKSGKRLDILSYLDSGPGVSCSSSHLVPDGEYQEALFRVLERFDAELDHVGSWHSHHCNGMNSLSSGDIAGYVETVNDPRYGCDLFIAMLVTGIKRRLPVSRYYVFTRGSRDFVELSRDEVQIVSGEFPFEGPLRGLEALSMSFPRGMERSDRREKKKDASGFRTYPAKLRKLLAEDNA